MDNRAQRKALHKISPSELVHHAVTLVRSAAEEFEPVSQDQVRWHGRAKRILFITDPKGEPAALLDRLLQSSRLEVDIMAVHNPSDLDNVYDRLAARAYDLLIPSNLELSPWYMPALVSFVRVSYPALKILAILGWDSPDFIQELNTRGINDFVHVPVRVEDLQQRIFRLLPNYFDTDGK